MSEYKFLSLEQSDIAIIDGDRGKNYPKQEDFVEKGFCLFLNTKNVREDGFDFSNAQFISKAKDDSLRKGKLQRDDIVLTTRGTLGNIGFYNQSISYNHIRINSGMVILRCGKNIYPKFIYLFLKSSIFKNQVQSFQSGSAQPQLPIKDLKCILIPDLLLSEQKQIADILSCLDNKIDNLRRQNETLETIAQTLFKHWFIDFEFPNDDGKPYKSSGGAMVATELGDIPAGWRVGKIEEIAKRIGMGPFGSRITTDNFVDNGIPVIRGNNLTNGFNEDGFVYLTPEKADELKSSNVFPEDLVFTHRGTLGQVGFIPTSSQYPRYVVSQSQMFLSVNKSLMSPRFIYRFFCSKPGLNALLANKNTTGVPSIASPSTSLRAIKILIPNIKLMQNFDLVITAIDFKKDGNKKQIETLTKTRDTLLPKLMSGQIRVKEGESIIEEE